MSTDTDTTPIEEWKTAKTGRQYVSVKGPGGGTIWRQENESIDDARRRHASQQEAKRNEQRTAGTKPRPKGKGRPADKPPQVPKADQVKPAKDKPSREQLAAAAELPLQVVAAFVGRAVLQCDFCAGSMMANSGAAAADIAKTTNPYLLSLLTWWHGLMSAVAGGDGLAKFLAPPIVHHAPLPAPLVEMVSPFLGVPPRAPRPAAHAHQPGPARAETRGPVQPPPPPPAPAGGGGPPSMTPEQAARLASMSPEQIQQERARLQAQMDLARRQAAAAAAGAPPGMSNIPSYRAADSLTPTQQRQMAAAQQAANGGGQLPNYQSGAQSAPGTPTAPSPQGANSAGSPLPPETDPLA